MKSRFLFTFSLCSLSIFSLTSLEAVETSFLNSYANTISKKLKLSSINKNNAQFKVEEKEDYFDYALKYKLSKYGYEDSFFDYSNKNFYNEDIHTLLFSTRIYFDDKVWLNFHLNHSDSSKNKINKAGSIAYKKRSLKEKSVVKLYYKPNSIITSNLSFENINNSIDYDRFTNQSYKETNNKKLSFNLNGKFDFLTIDSSFYQIIKDNNYLSKNSSKEEYFKTSEEIYRGVKLSISKEILENLKITTTAKFASMEILNSNVEKIIGKDPTYLPKKQADFKIEYLYKNISFKTKINHISSRFINGENSEKLPSYTLTNVGASFKTKINNENVKVDLNIRNILNKKYELYSGRQGDSINYFLNFTMKF